MDIGLHGPEDQEQLIRALASIESMAELCGKVPDDLTLLSATGSELKRVIDALPEPQVDLRLTITEGLAVAHGSLGLVRNIIVDNGPPIVPAVLPVLLRSALLGACRVLYMLGPETERERIANARVVLQQEAYSFYQAYTQFAEFEQFGALVPPPDQVTVYEARRAKLLEGGRPRGEARILDSMAEVVSKLLAAAESDAPKTEVDNHAKTIKEHVRWLFHVHSGIAHGFGWPRLVPSTQSLPGHFIADLTMIASLAHLAADVTLRRAGLDGSVE